MSSYATKNEERSRLTADRDGNVYRDGLPCPAHPNGFGYLKVRAGHQTFKVHQIVALRFLGEPCNQARYPRLSALLPSVHWVVAHKNGNKADNRLANLMWCPQSFNVRHERFRQNGVGTCPLLQIETKRAAQRRQYRRRRAVQLQRCRRVTLPCGRTWCRPASVFVGIVFGKRLATRARARMLGNRFATRKLSEPQVREIRSIGSEVSQREIARRFGVSATQVARILRGDHW